MKIKCIVFDLGGVLVKDSEDDVLQELSRHTGRELLLLRETIERHRREVTIGEKSLLEMYDAVIRELRIDTLRASQMLDIHLDIHRRCSIEPDNGILHLVSALKTARVVACLTNTEPEIHRMNKEHGLYSHFHKAFVSVELGMAKPDQEIFRQVLHDLHASPGEVAFIDDKKPNVDSAALLGIQGLQFLGIQRLRADLDHLP